MRVTVTTTITPAMPVKRTVDAESTLEAVREVLNQADMSGFFERTTKRGGGNIVISAFPARDDKPAQQGGLLFQ